MSVHERLLQPENLNYAWVKAKELLRMADGHIDRAEAAAFELELEEKLHQIQKQFKQGKYKLRPLRPLPRPKKITESGSENRQYYHVAIEDQVAWIAIANAIGPELDRKMHPWSYGNRLYRPAWYEHSEAGPSKLEIGPYRHASGHLYRKFQHSWPLFRRHITLTARMMARKGKLPLDEIDTADQLAAATAERDDLIYFRPDWWAKQAAEDSAGEIFHASIDLEKFYPNLNLSAVLKGLNTAGALEEPTMSSLVGSMLDFRIDFSGIPNEVLEGAQPEFPKDRPVGLPTGLFVSGFLANAAMLPVDDIVAERAHKSRNVAHFRFVDDHAILSSDFNALCDWIVWYEELLEDSGVGPKVNPDKYDPPELAEFLNFRKEGASEGQLAEKRKLAIQETRLDGRNPTKLMTKTLAQVSAIATTDIHILDDDDLDERLNILEWLLLADIPEREIRPDTRASFAAGQIASLIPVLVQEVDGVVEIARQLADHQKREPDPSRSTSEDQDSYRATLEELSGEWERRAYRQHDWENTLLKRCFGLLLQSLRQHPGKARLFSRVHQYCQYTGYNGIKEIAEWIEELRAAGHRAWANYYASLSFQLMAKAVFPSALKVIENGHLRSDTRAAENYLRDISKLDTSVFILPTSQEAWFHAVARKEFGVSLKQVASLLGKSGHEKLARDIEVISENIVSLNLGETSAAWIEETGWPVGVWAHIAENHVENNHFPSAAWSAAIDGFDFSNKLDLLSVRRYPECFPDAAWNEIVSSGKALPRDDSAWLRQVISNNEGRLLEARESSKTALSRAVRSIDSTSADHFTLKEWTEKVKSLSLFDPRRSEWTGLEIAKKILEEASSADGDIGSLDRLHPENILVPKRWFGDLNGALNGAEVSWEQWRKFIAEETNGDVQVKPLRSSILDYRFAKSSQSGMLSSPEERRFTAVGRVLIGILCEDHSAPRIWNLRGNELVFPFPRGRLYSELAISSATTQLLDACLAPRPAETRNIAFTPELFAWSEGEDANDVTFDPEPINNLTDLISNIRDAQSILVDNQLSVSSNRPRQLIPFKLEDFAIGADEAEANDPNGGQHA